MLLLVIFVLLSNVYLSKQFGDFNFSISARNLVLPTAFLVAFGLIIGFMSISKVKNISSKYIKSAGTLLLLLITLAELLRFHYKYNSFSDKQFAYPETGVTSYLAEESDRFLREKAEILPPNMWMPYRLKSVSGYSTTHSLRYNRFIAYLNTGNFSGEASRYVEVDNYNSNLLDYLGISHIVAIKRKEGAPDYEGQPSWKFDDLLSDEVYSEDRVSVLRNSKSYPRVYPVFSYHVAANDDEFIELFNDLDLSTTVILEEELDFNLKKSDVEISDVLWGDQSMQFNVKADKPTILVTSQAYDNGWKLNVDDKSRDILRANYAFMAIPINQDDHSVSLIYRPKEFNSGLVIFGLSFAAFIVLVIVYKKRKI